ncbi:glycosyltransferase family protein [Candidatus Woesearchaeota archaeon]|nr:glycosyltransferase family protein [Candidatus Woesearchaeota archaeon]
MKVGCIIQARSGSSRLPKKVLMKIEEKEMLSHVVSRVLNSKQIDVVIVATTTQESDNLVEECIKTNHPDVKVYRGSEDDVLDRFYNAAKENNLDTIVRITGDCPVIDWNVIDEIIINYKKGYDYASNVLPVRTYPRGLDAEVFGFNILEWMWKNCTKKSEREHVTTYIRENESKFKIYCQKSSVDKSNLRWTVDEESDFKLITEIYHQLYPLNNNFGYNDILELFEKNPELENVNKFVEQKKELNNNAN